MVRGEAVCFAFGVAGALGSRAVPVPSSDFVDRTLLGNGCGSGPPLGFGWWLPFSGHFLSQPESVVGGWSLALLLLLCVLTAAAG